ncbi:GNAT family N-acetyltransferase [Paenibacillus guangzhouensis]|uniref:GNAT family N-acetyltransferase n=1 Tax=Paenibacillus guangzhouensis TaxID=1473112 RepID=UPI001266E31C|nr:GNAT family protein [Paenibacillus guangzhouensis]
MDFPILETRRLKLRQLRLDDAPDLYDYFSQDKVTTYYDLDRFTELKQAEDLIQMWIDNFDSQRSIRWGITLKSEDRVIGTCGFHKWSQKHHRAEIGYELSPAYWRQGYMGEVVDAVVRYGFHGFDLHRIEAQIFQANIGSRKVLEKIGFQEEGVLQDYFYLKDQYVDAVIFAMCKSGKWA